MVVTHLPGRYLSRFSRHFSLFLLRSVLLWSFSWFPQWTLWLHRISHTLRDSLLYSFWRPYRVPFYTCYDVARTTWHRSPGCIKDDSRVAVNSCWISTSGETLLRRKHVKLAYSLYCTAQPITLNFSVCIFLHDTTRLNLRHNFVLSTRFAHLVDMSINI